MVTFFWDISTRRRDNDNVDDDCEMMILMLLLILKMMRMVIITSGGKRPGGLATTTTPVMPKAATAILQTPQWSLQSVGYNMATEGEPKYGTYLRRKKDKIIVMAGLEKNMAVESPSGNLHKNMMALL